MTSLRILLAAAVAVALCGCSGDSISGSEVKQREDAIKQANKEGLERNPPPPGEGPGD